MDNFFRGVALLWLLAIVACVIAAIWTMNARWAATAVVLTAVMVLITLLGNESSESE